MKSFFNSHFINYKTKASHLTSWSLSFKIHKMWPLLLLLNQGLSNIDQKLNCPPSLLFQLCGFPTDPEVCVEAPGPLSSWSALFYDNLGFQIPQEQIQIDKAKYWNLDEHFLLWVWQQADVTYREIWNYYPLKFSSDFYVSLPPLCLEQSHIHFILSLVLCCRSVCLLSGYSSWTKPHLHARKVDCVVHVFFSSA